MPRKEHHSTPTIVGRFLYSDLPAIPIDTPAFFDWLSLHKKAAGDRRSLGGGGMPLTGTRWGRCQRHHRKHRIAVPFRTSLCTVRDRRIRIVSGAMRWTTEAAAL